MIGGKGVSPESGKTNLDHMVGGKCQGTQEGMGVEKSNRTIRSGDFEYS